MKIYLITNLLNDKQYVGRTFGTLKARFAGHYSDMASAIGNEMRLHRQENFTIELLEEFEGTKDIGRELFWIRKLKTFAPNGYNVQKPKQRDTSIRIWKIEKQHHMRTFSSVIESQYIEILNQIAAKKGISSKRLGRQIIVKYLLRNGLIPDGKDPFDE